MALSKDRVTFGLLVAGLVLLAATLILPLKAASSFGLTYGATVWNHGTRANAPFYWAGCGTETGCSSFAVYLNVLIGPLLLAALVMGVLAALRVLKGIGGRALAWTSFALIAVAVPTLWFTIDQVHAGLSVAIGTWTAIVALGFAFAGAVLIPPRPAPGMFDPLPPSSIPAPPWPQNDQGQTTPPARPPVATTKTSAKPAPVPAAPRGAKPVAAAGAPAPAAGLRRLQCPRCKAIMTVAAGVKPRCSACGFA